MQAVKARTAVPLHASGTDSFRLRRPGGPHAFKGHFADNHKLADYMEQELQLNEHNKQEYPPMHTAEHILNQTMVRMFGCPRSMNAHIERKKSKCDYDLDKEPTQEQVAEIERKVNEIIESGLDVTAEYMPVSEASKIADLRKLPENVSDTLRIVRIGDYDACACIGAHVDNTSEIGRFKIISHSYENGKWRVRFKLEQQ